MSNVNIKRAVQNIRANTTPYTPLVEVIVNAIQSIETEREAHTGEVAVEIFRERELDLDTESPPIRDIFVTDNGTGFNQKNRDSFDTLYSDQKIEIGGKGFGRFTCLRYFESVEIESIFSDKNQNWKRKFSMGDSTDIIVGESLTRSVENKRTTVKLQQAKSPNAFDKSLPVIARHLVERLLPYFIAKDSNCPRLLLRDSSDGSELTLNDYFKEGAGNEIVELTNGGEELYLKAAEEERFHVRVFKFYSPRNNKSKISLTAHKREVSGSFLHKYVPEFSDEFYDLSENGKNNSGKNFIVKAYVFGDYLDRHVSVERGGFEFQTEHDILFGLSQTDIEKPTAELAKSVLGENITKRQEKKRRKVEDYVNNRAPWHKEVARRIQLASLPFDATEQQIELYLQKEKYEEEVRITKDVKEILATDSATSDQKIQSLVDRISGSSKNDLIHYIATRRNILDLFKKSLEINETGKYETEGSVHDVIFPRRSDDTSTAFYKHNLWMIDERLNFTTYISSDNKLGPTNAERPDILVFNNRVAFRGENERSNPVTIFEFKRPNRDDFVNPSSNEDPIAQIIRYVNDIRDGRYSTPEGRDIQVETTTPFYGYVVCDLTAKVTRWLDREKNFTPMPDKKGWFDWLGNINLYIEVLSWDKLYEDAVKRNQVFFNHLGI